jgi:hypothetical protein
MSRPVNAQKELTRSALVLYIIGGVACVDEVISVDKNKK